MAVFFLLSFCGLSAFCKVDCSYVSGVLKRTKAKFSFPGVEFGLYIGSNQIGLLSGKSFSFTLSLNSGSQLEGVIFAL